MDGETGSFDITLRTRSLLPRRDDRRDHTLPRSAAPA